MRALARLGVVHAPDLPFPTDAAEQLAKERSTDALQEHGTVLILATSDASATMSPEDTHKFLTATKDEAKECLYLVAEMKNG